MGGVGKHYGVVILYPVMFLVGRGPLGNQGALASSQDEKRTFAK